MSGHKLRVFFYGSFINPEVLAEVDMAPERIEVARLSGFDIRIEPLANIIRSDRHCVYGIVCEATHEELGRLYGQDWVGTYLPEAVLVETSAGGLLPALCYIAPASEPSPARSSYIDRITTPAREYGFPRWYLQRLNSFRRVATNDA